jgi:basic amino acid/polyamine antiporter, APA family
LAAVQLFSPEVASIFALLMALSLGATVNAMMTIGPRVYYSMATRGAFPLFASKLNRAGAPGRAVAAQGLFAALLVVTPFPSLVLYTGFTLNFFAALTVAALFLLRRRSGWQRLPLLDRVWPVAPVFFLLTAAWMTGYGMMMRPIVAAIAIGFCLLAALGWSWRQRTLTPQPLRTL